MRKNIKTESIHKNRIYCIMCNVTESVKVWMINQKLVITLKSNSKMDQYLQILSHKMTI